MDRGTPSVAGERQKVSQACAAVNEQHRLLPMTRIEKDYIFTGPDGKLRLADLFDIIDTYNYLNMTFLGCQEQAPPPRPILTPPVVGRGLALGVEAFLGMKHRVLLLRPPDEHHSLRGGGRRPWS